MEEVQLDYEIPFRPLGEDFQVRRSMEVANQRMIAWDNQNWFNALEEEDGSRRRRCAPRVGSKEHSHENQNGTMQNCAMQNCTDQPIRTKGTGEHAAIPKNLLCNLFSNPMCGAKRLRHCFQSLCLKRCSWSHGISCGLRLPKKQTVPSSKMPKKLSLWTAVAKIFGKMPNGGLALHAPYNLSEFTELPKPENRNNASYPFNIRQHKNLHHPNTIPSSPPFNSRSLIWSTNIKKPSILGPTPINISLDKTIPYLSSTKTKYISLNPTTNRKAMEQSDEELIKKFADLHTNSHEEGAIVLLPTGAINLQNWELCVLTKVLSDRAIFQAQFEWQMRRAWAVHPTTKFTMQERGLFVIQCATRGDYDKILNDGPWTYRQDLVLTAECASEEEVQEGRLTHTELWVQFHNLPAKGLTEEGINILTSQVGTALSEPAFSSYNSKQYLRVKIMISLSKPLRDKITTTNPMIGDFVTCLVYEKIGRICCFCGSLGHEISSCSDRARLAKIKARMAGQ